MTTAASWISICLLYASTIKALREKIGDGKVLCALSGGVDSSVAAVMLSKAIGKQLTCVFVDHGLLRKNEGDEVEAVFGPEGQYDLNFIRVNAQERFYARLKGVEEPEACLLYTSSLIRMWLISYMGQVNVILPQRISLISQD